MLECTNLPYPSVVGHFGTMEFLVLHGIAGVTMSLTPAILNVP